MDTTPPADEKKGAFSLIPQNLLFILLFFFLTPCCLLLPAAEPKDEKEAVKPEEAAKLQNGDGSKEGGATAAAAAAASEEKKKAKSRFMFNIADGGFTGTSTRNQADWTVISLFVLLHLDSVLPCRAPFPVAERGARRHRHQENERDLAPPPRLLAAGRHHTVSFSDWTHSCFVAPF